VAAGVNDQKQHADELADLLHHWNLGRHVNIIPYNPIADSEFQRPTKASVSLRLKSIKFSGIWQYVEVLV